MVNWPLTQFDFIQNDHAVSQNSSHVSNYANLNRSKGNYIVDADGNTMLDLGGSGDLNPLGYNHDLFRNVVKSKDFDNSLINGFSAD